jgi:RNA polymerase sigma factor (sigma-70 family)
VLDWEEGTQGPPQLFSQEIARVVKEALGTLNEVQKRTIEMVFFEGLTLRDVSEKTKESLSNVRNHYYRGLERLRSCLTEQPEGVRRGGAVSVGEVNHVKA